MLGAGSGSRPMLYPPRGRTPTLVAHEFLVAGLDPGTARSCPTSGSPRCPPPNAARRSRRRASGGRTGVEYGPETTPSVHAGGFAGFADRSDATFVDAQPLLVDLRSRKSAAEVERVERACAVTAEAFSRTFEAVSKGTTGREVESCFRRHLLDCGGTASWTLVTCGSGEYDRTASGGSDRVVEEGAMVWIDGGCAVDGYFADSSRAGVVGGPGARPGGRRADTCEAIDVIEPGLRTVDP